MPDCGPSVAPGWAPDWIWCPQDRILQVVVDWIVAGFVAVGNAFTDAVYAVFDSLGLAGTSAGDALVSSGEVVAGTVYNAAYSVNNAILDVASAAGLAAPVVVVVLYAGVGAVFVVSLVALRKGVLWIT